MPATRGASSSKGIEDHNNGIRVWFDPEEVAKEINLGMNSITAEIDSL